MPETEEQRLYREFVDSLDQSLQAAIFDYKREGQLFPGYSRMIADDVHRYIYGVLRLARERDI